MMFYGWISGVDPVNAIIYKQNADIYINQLDELDAKFQSIIDNAVRKTLVFGDCFPFLDEPVSGLDPVVTQGLYKIPHWYRIFRR